ncbi:MAG: amidohydrolase family protein [Gemmatimonadales bacterium]
MRIDTNSFLGAYPFRRVPGTAPDALIQAMDRAGIDRAWVSHLPSVFWRDPAQGNDWLYETAERYDRFDPIPAVHPGLNGWEEVVAGARTAGAPAVRSDPTYYGLDPAGAEMQALVQRCAAEEVPLLLAVRLEDARQRHPNDRAPELPPWAVRALIRSHGAARIIVTHADRPFVEEVHFGSTPAESARIWWDISWIWGPPEDHLETLLQTVGVERFVFGTGQPLRLPETSVAKLDLLDLPAGQRAAIESENLKNVTLTPREPRGKGPKLKRSSAPSLRSG